MDIANYIVWYVNRNPNEPLGTLTPLKLQKILYYVATSFLKSRDELLFPEPFQKWQYGPVVKEVYQEFKTVGVNHIQYPKLSLHEKGLAVFGRTFKPIYEHEIINSDQGLADLISGVVDKLIDKKAFYLVGLTHKEKAWESFEEDIMSGKRELTYSTEELYLAETI